jgi:hypothetical protein
MDFKDIGNALAKIGLPLLGAALPVPGGAALGMALASHIGSPSTAATDIMETLTQSAEAREKAVEFQATHAETLLRITTDAEQARYLAEVADRNGARDAAVKGGTSTKLFWLSVLLLTICLGGELALLFKGYPKDVPEIIVGRVLGLLDAITLMVLAFWYGDSHGNQNTVGLLARAPAINESPRPTT